MNARDSLLSTLPRHLVGQALMQIERVPVIDLSQSQEYAAPGTRQWVAETVAVLQRIVNESEATGV